MRTERALILYFVGLLIVSNMYTIGRVLNALIFSQRTHLQRAVAKHDLIQSEGNVEYSIVLCFIQDTYCTVLYFTIQATCKQ